MNITGVDTLRPLVFTDLVFGAKMPYAFATLTMNPVGEALQARI